MFCVTLEYEKENSEYNLNFWSHPHSRSYRSGFQAAHVLIIYKCVQIKKHRHAKRAGVIFSIDWVAWGRTGCWSCWDGLFHGWSYLCMIHVHGPSRRLRATFGKITQKEIVQMF